MAILMIFDGQKFLSTPSARRATNPADGYRDF